MAGRTLLIFAHPAYERARLNPALLTAAAALPDVTVRDLYELYPDFAVDVPAEQRLLVEHDHLVLQFPLYWWSCPSLLKEWLDLTFLHGFAYGDTGDALAGKSMLCAVTTGGPDASYRPESGAPCGLEAFLMPWSRTAALCRMRWLPPFAVHGAARLTQAELGAESARYAERLSQMGEP